MSGTRRIPIISSVGELVEREPTGWDFNVTNFICDDAWYNLDLSAIVPQGAKFVVIFLAQAWSTATQGFSFRKTGGSASFKWADFPFPGAPMWIQSAQICPVGSDRIVQYSGSSYGTLYDVAMSIIGWRL